MDRENNWFICGSGPLHMQYCGRYKGITRPDKIPEPVTSGEINNLSDGKQTCGGRRVKLCGEQCSQLENARLYFPPVPQLKICWVYFSNSVSLKGYLALSIFCLPVVYSSQPVTFS
jgi:hypothetical protein